MERLGVSIFLGLVSVLRVYIMERLGIVSVLKV